MIAPPSTNENALAIGIEGIEHAWFDAAPTWNSQQDATQDATQKTAYDSVWADTSIPVQESTGIEAVLLKQDKLYAVLAVVLIIWLGIAFFLVRTDRRIDRLERQVDNGSNS